MKTEDIRITQYALGELTGTEREAFEKEMATDPELLEEVRQTQKFCESVPTHPEMEAAFSDAERESLMKRIRAKRMDAAERKSGTIWPRVWVYGGIAAGIVVLANLSIPAVTGGLRRAQMTWKSEIVDSSFIASRDSQVASTHVPPATSGSVQDEIKKQLVESSMSLAATTSSPVNFRVVLPTAAPVASAGAVVSELPAEKAKNAAVGVDLMQSPQITTRSGLAATREVVREFIYPADSARYLAQPVQFNTEGYNAITENPFLSTKENPLSTFSIDVDTASYSNIRRFLQQQDQLPPKGAVRIEELINYFPYTYPQPEGKEPFSVNVETGRAPWNPQHELVRVALKGRDLSADKRPASNLVFLIDVSGSMNEPNKLPLLQRSLSELASRLAPKDRVAIVVYAGSSGLVLPSTSNKGEILKALDRLKAGGSTNGGEGIKLAYEQAREHFVEEGNNRVILCTDGDFNVGVTNEQALVDLIEKQRASGVFLSVLGFGSGNLKDSQMEKLADKGNGNYAYIDSPAEGRKVLVEQMGSTLFTIAKDVKIQVEFNPATVAGYRLVGYENRLLAKEDFNDDKKDAGEIGAGHTVTAFYEVVPVGQPLPDADSVDALKYQQPTDSSKIEPVTVNPSPNELLTVKLRYKQPEGSTSQLLEVPVPNEAKDFEKCSTDFQFATAVAAFGLKLRDSKYVGDLNWSEIQKIARANLGEDPGSYRAEFLTLVEKARQITRDREEQKSRDE